MKKIFKRIVGAVLISALTFTSLNVQSTGTYAASKNKKAIAEYNKVLLGKKENDGWVKREDNYQFQCVDFNGDGIKEMIVYNREANAKTCMRLYGFVDNKVKILRKSEWISWYKKSKVLVFDSTWGGEYIDSYCILNKSGKLVEKASYDAVDSSLYKYAKKNVKYKDKKNDMYYISCKINGKETSYKKYKKAFKKLTKGEKEESFKLKENTAENRKKYLK